MHIKYKNVIFSTCLSGYLWTIFSEFFRMQQGEGEHTLVVVSMSTEALASFAASVNISLNSVARKLTRFFKNIGKSSPISKINTFCRVPLVVVRMYAIEMNSKAYHLVSNINATPRRSLRNRRERRPFSQPRANRNGVPRAIST